MRAGKPTHTQIQTNARAHQTHPHQCPILGPTTRRHSPPHHPQRATTPRQQPPDGRMRHVCICGPHADLRPFICMHVSISTLSEDLLSISYTCMMYITDRSMDGRRESEAHTYTQTSHTHTCHATIVLSETQRRGLGQERNEHLFWFLVGESILPGGRGVRARLFSTCMHLRVYA